MLTFPWGAIRVCQTARSDLLFNVSDLLFNGKSHIEYAVIADWFLSWPWTCSGHCSLSAVCRFVCISEWVLPASGLSLSRLSWHQYISLKLLVWICQVAFWSRWATWWSSPQFLRLKIQGRHAAAFIRSTVRTLAIRVNLTTRVQGWLQ